MPGQRCSQANDGKKLSNVRAGSGRTNAASSDRRIPSQWPERKAKPVSGGRTSPAYERLVAVGQMLMESIKRSKGRDNKSLAKFADQLRQMLEKWEA